jgi:hypothetical protein
MRTTVNSELRLRQTAAQMHALAEVRREIGSHDSASGRKYLREFTKAFRRYDSILSSEQLNEKITAADVVLIGDYHALAASQRFAAELLEKRAQGRPVVLGVEAVLARDQRILDGWWRREISEDELRRRLRFDHEWGYHWEPLYELLSAARDHAEAVYGLDCLPRHDWRKIGSRDRHAAAKIGELREHHPGAAIFVLFGESHMAPQHLPGLVKDVLPDETFLTVLQNVDSLYWEAVEERAPAVSLGADTVCVFNSSPLEKYESYRLCLERWNQSADEPPDFAPAVYNLIASLAQCLGFRLDSPHNGTQPRFLSDSLPEVVCVTDEGGPSAESTALLEQNGCIYLPQTNTFLIREFRMAAVAHEATRFLYFACHGMTETCSQAKAIEDALAHFGSRLLNPSLDTNCGSHHHATDSECAQGLGESLYQAYLSGQITTSALRRIFLAHAKDRDQAEKVFASIKRVVMPDSST